MLDQFVAFLMAAALLTVKNNKIDSYLEMEESEMKKGRTNHAKN